MFGLPARENEKNWKLMEDTSREFPRPSAHYTAFFPSFSNSRRISLRNQQSASKRNLVINWHKCFMSDKQWHDAFLHIEISYFKSSTVTTNQERNWTRSKTTRKSLLTLQEILACPIRGHTGRMLKCSRVKNRRHVVASQPQTHYIPAVCELRAWRRAQSHLT